VALPLVNSRDVDLRGEDCTELLEEIDQLLLALRREVKSLKRKVKTAEGDQ
jgi:hypothetical protein